MKHTAPAPALVLALTVGTIGAVAQDRGAAQHRPQDDSQQIVVNGKILDVEEVALLAQLGRQYGAHPIPGRYWYDRLSGLYGQEGGPTVGQVLPGLPIGGELRENASNGTSNVWVNGRRLTLSEIAFITTCTTPIPGRYWMDAQGNSGPEGGPMRFNLAALCAQARGSHGSYRGKYGSVLSDGTTTGAMFRNSNGSITSVTCGPDGGCIY